MLCAVMLNAVMLYVANNPFMLCVIMLNVVMLSVVAPPSGHTHKHWASLDGLAGAFVNYGRRKFYNIVYRSCFTGATATGAPGLGSSSFPTIPAAVPVPTNFRRRSRRSRSTRWLIRIRQSVTSSPDWPDQTPAS
jgi:hypothetical protein